MKLNWKNYSKIWCLMQENEMIPPYELANYLTQIAGFN